MSKCLLHCFNSCYHYVAYSIFYDRYVYILCSLEFFCLLIWQIASQFFDYSWNLWQTDIQKILHGFLVLAQNNSELHHDDMYLICERWFLCSKIIRQLIVSGFPSDAKSVQVNMLSVLLSSPLFSFLCFSFLVFLSICCSIYASAPLPISTLMFVTNLGYKRSHFAF